MIHRNICPICGSENPEGSEFCQVCKANLQALPSEMFPVDPDPIEQEQNTESISDPVIKEEPQPDGPVPIWLKDKLKPTEKKQPMDFDAFSDMLFGVSDSRKPANTSKSSKNQNNKKSQQAYQPPLQNFIEPPLIEPEPNDAQIYTEEIPGLADFLLMRPARKWEDRKPQPQEKKGSSVAMLTDFSNERPAKKWDDQPPAAKQSADHKKTEPTLVQPDLWWKQDPPLVEVEEPIETAKGSEYDNSPLANSSSPTKVINAEEIFSENKQEIRESSAQNKQEDFQPESGSLLSDLLNDINSSSGSLTPAEQQQNQDGIVFYSGNHPENNSDAEDNSDLVEISISDEDNTTSAEMLDQILRNIGYMVEGEAQPENQPGNAQETESVPEQPEPNSSESLPVSAKNNGLLRPIRQLFAPRVVDNPLILPEEDEETEETDPDPYGLSIIKIPEKEDTPDDQEIPWDLFGSADMALPQSPEDPAYRTFSRGSIPEDAESTTYQQRMISSILGKIIQAENYYEPEKEKNNREISFWSRLLLSLLAICGVIFILSSGFTDRLEPPVIPTSAESQDFYQYAESVTGNALVIIDYTPAYNSLMENAADSLLTTLETHADKVYLAALNPSAMPGVQQILSRHEDKIVFSGWWPSGIISIRARLAAGNIPDQIWLLSTESTSVRVWAEQLAVSGSDRKLHVMGPEQLQPILKPYLQTELITSMLSNDSDLKDFGSENHSADRNQMAVWYLAALVPLAWIFGIIGKVMKTEPDYERKSKIRTEQFDQDEEKESEND